ncbi:DUF6640 family protein [Sorangium sp. So ce693]|uniref:DUF6640 family protein n=1 Tax=Sorangium sp. So ce693 TaxID=3133318 RepID=UPI003F5E1143
MPTEDARSPAPLASRILVTVVALATLAGPYLADWNETHIYNPRWPPHAKFHNAQTMLLGTALGACAIAFTWRRAADARASLRVAVVFGALYWLTQMGSILFPGTAFVDPERAGQGTIAGLPAQILISVVLLGLLGAALALARGGPVRQS